MFTRRALNKLGILNIRNLMTKGFQQHIFSGIQPTGTVHLGNYFGAIRRWVKLQDTGDTFIYSIVDLHSITLPQDPKQLQQNILEMTATLLACGIDQEKSILFQQSAVRQHTELCWILSTIATMSRLAHLPQYKEKSNTLKEVPLGLYLYPILQAADILLYKTTEVPVGEDQLQHIQMAQQLVKTFNYRFGKTFPTPKALVLDNYSSRVRSLRDPSKKMSKSDPDAKSRISLTDSPDEILEKCKKAVTDCTSKVTYEPEERPGVANLITIHSMLSGKPIDVVCSEAAGQDTGQYKLTVAEVVIESLRPIRKEIGLLMKDPGSLLEALKDGRDRAEELAEETMQEVRSKVGFDLTTDWASAEVARSLER